MYDRPSPISISAMKKYVLCYLEWKEEGVDVSGNRITPEITAHYEEICEMLRELGEKLP